MRHCAARKQPRANSDWPRAPRFFLRGCGADNRASWRMQVVVMLCPISLSVMTHSRQDTEAVVRCSPAEDATIGFFVSCFVRHRGAPSDTSKAEAAVAGCNSAPGAQPVMASAKRKVHTEGNGDNTSMQPTSSGRRKRRK